MGAKVVHVSETRVFLEGSEVCREYFKTGKITFGSSTLLAGQSGTVDPGHPVSHEVFFVSRGHVLLSNPTTKTVYELKEGDAILIPEGEPHELINIGAKKAIVTWSCAPSPE
jgi:oxalate decarboxylase/phosphoglucose isomerase-like protein (cupin superfamily)